MSAFQPDAAEHEALSTMPSRAKRPLWQRMAIGAGVAVVVIAAAAAVLYTFGGMGGSAYDPEIKAAYQQLIQTDQAGPVEKRFVIPIPGCTCHSTDPYLTEQHRNRRLSECMGCHGG